MSEKYVLPKSVMEFFNKPNNVSWKKEAPRDYTGWVLTLSGADPREFETCSCGWQSMVPKREKEDICPHCGGKLAYLGVRRTFTASERPRTIYSCEPDDKPGRVNIIRTKQEFKYNPTTKKYEVFEDKKLMGWYSEDPMMIDIDAQYFGEVSTRSLFGEWPLYKVALKLGVERWNWSRSRSADELRRIFNKINSEGFSREDIAHMNALLSIYLDSHTALSLDRWLKSFGYLSDEIDFVKNDMSIALNNPKNKGFVASIAYRNVGDVFLKFVLEAKRNVYYNSGFLLDLLCRDVITLEVFFDTMSFFHEIKENPTVTIRQYPRTEITPDANTEFNFGEFIKKFSGRSFNFKKEFCSRTQTLLDLGLPLISDNYLDKTFFSEKNKNKYLYKGDFQEDFTKDPLECLQKMK